MNAKQQYKIAYHHARIWHKVNQRNGLNYAWWFVLRMADDDNIPLHLIVHCIRANAEYHGSAYHH